MAEEAASLEITRAYKLAKNKEDVVPPTEPAPQVKMREEAYDDASSAIRQQVWGVKNRLDAIPEKMYYRVRDALFPLAHTGGTVKFKNRAGHKLLQSMEAVGMWEHVNSLGKRCAFADVCGGPGAFSQALHATCPKGLKLQGYGMTLVHPDLGWYDELFKKHKFIATNGIDGTGNIFHNDNIEALASLTSDAPLRLVVADGGFDVSWNLANYQEVISNRIVYGQWYAAVRILTEGGCFVLKLFDTFAPFTRSLLYLSLFCFKDVQIVKPKHSRIVNSERYLVCSGFTGLSNEWVEYLNWFHVNGFPDEATTPISVVPQRTMEEDAEFMDCMEKMNDDVAKRQIHAIELLLDSEMLKTALSGGPLPEKPSAVGQKREREAPEEPVPPAEAKEDEGPAPAVPDTVRAEAAAQE